MPTAEAAQAPVLARQVRNIEATEKPESSIRPLIDGLSIVLAVVSIVFALVQKVESGHLMEDTQKLVKEATTGFAGEFPRSIPTITGIVQGGCEHTQIMADVPGYGQYSAPDDFFCAQVWPNLHHFW
jgi:hypothetical protein